MQRKTQRWLFFLLVLFILDMVIFPLLVRALTDPPLPVTQQWSRQWGGPYEAYAEDVVVDAAGNAFVVGSMEDNGLLLEYNATGGLKWSAQWGGFWASWGKGIALDSTGAKYIVGTISLVSGYHRGFLVKYHANKTMAWNYTWGAPHDTIANDITVSNNGDIYVSAYYTNKSDNATLVKFNSGGQLEWVREWSPTKYSWGYGVTTDFAGNIYFVGEFSNGTNTNDIFLLKYNATGHLLWATYWHSFYEMGFDVVTDAQGNCYVAGCLIDYTNNSALLVKFNPIGQPIWNRTWRGAQTDCAFGIAIAGSDQFLAAGFFMAPGDGALLGFGTDGAFHGSLVWGLGNEAKAEAVAVRETSLYLVGTVTNLTSGRSNLYLVKYETSGGGIPGFSFIHTMLTLLIPVIGVLLMHPRKVRGIL